MLRATKKAQILVAPRDPCAPETTPSDVPLSRSGSRRDWRVAWILRLLWPGQGSVIQPGPRRDSLRFWSGLRRNRDEESVFGAG